MTELNDTYSTAQNEVARMTPELREQMLEALLAHKQQEAQKGIIECPVPAMSSPLGAYWEQPSRNGMVFTKRTVTMSQADKDALATYNRSTPSGIYSGKMWKVVDQHGVEHLYWYAANDEHSCSMHSRQILVRG